MKKYVIQWKDPEGFCHFVDGSLHGSCDGIVFHNSWDDAAANMADAKEYVKEYMKGTAVVKRRLFGPPTISYVNKPSEHLVNMHKRMYDTMHIVDMNIMPKQMR